MLKLEENPPVLSSWLPSLDAATGRWWVAHTRANAEKSTAWALDGKRVSYFLPMTPRTIFSGGRKRHGMKPLFQSYVFFCGDDEARLAAISCRHVCQILAVPDQLKLLRELSDIDRCLASGSPMDVYPSLAQGDRCRVVAGPLMGLEGTLVRTDNKSKLVLQVSLLAQGAALEIDASLLEKIESPRAMFVSPQRAGSAQDLQLILSKVK